MISPGGVVLGTGSECIVLLRLGCTCDDGLKNTHNSKPLRMVH